MTGLKMGAAIGALAIAALASGCAEETTVAVNDSEMMVENDMMANDMAMNAGAMTGVTRAETMLAMADGTQAGRAIAEAADGGIRMTIEAVGVTPGEHGVHVHTTGRCDAPTFESAGSHWNPADQAHGLEDPAGQHAGDMPNIEIGEDGRGTLTYMLEGGTFEQMFDADGSAVIIHEGRDDQVTDPSGDSGSRVACGVLQPA